MTQEPEKKIIVDEDWKTQVERERATAPESSESPVPAATETAKPKAEVQLPPATLIYLATSLYYQAISSLGHIPDPATGKAEKNLPVAKHAIDLLDMLQQKTEGNRTPDESADLEAMLHQLRMEYVRAAG